MIPGPYAFFLLAFAAYRLTRLGGWDDFPPIAKVREWLIGEEWVMAPDVEQPGKTPDSPIEGMVPSYRRPTLAHLVHCPFCLGWWVCLATYIAWWLIPTQALVAATVLAMSGIVGLISKVLDA